MKKLIMVALAAALMTGCSAGKEETVKTEIKAMGNSKETLEKETAKVKFDKPFTAKVGIKPSESGEIKLTVKNYDIVENKSTYNEDNGKYDYVQLDVSLENTGKKEVSENVVDVFSFNFFDANGVELKADFIMKSNISDITYKSAAVRPGGKNEGRLYIPIPKGSKPEEMVYLTNWLSIFGSNEYIFKIKQ